MMRTASLGIALCLIAVSGRAQNSAQDLEASALENQSIHLQSINEAEWPDSRMADAEPEALPTADLPGGLIQISTPSEPDGVREPEEAEKPDGIVDSAGDPLAPPLNYSGRLFFTKPNGKDARCSAQFIAPQVVLTAAHCVRNADTGEWNKNFRFALQYHKGQFSKQYGHVCLATKGGWVKKRKSDRSDYRWDYAMLLVKEKSVTGSFGWHYGWRGHYSNAAKIGYPGEIERGRVVQVERGPLFFPRERPGIVAIKHNNAKSGKGSSGGALVGNYATRTGPGINRVISVTSASYGSDPLVDIGPYLDENFKQLFEFVSRGCKS